MRGMFMWGFLYVGLCVGCLMCVVVYVLVAHGCSVYVWGCLCVGCSWVVCLCVGLYGFVSLEGTLTRSTHGVSFSHRQHTWDE